MEIGIAFIISAFIAGVITFLAPCTLPLVPGYLGFISGVSNKDFDNPELAPTARKKIITNGIAFVLGFSVIFILFGALAGFLGQQLAVYQVWLSRIGGVFVIFFGLFMLGAFKLRILSFDKKMKIPKFLHIGKPSSSFVVGSAFAVGWTPCVGPILGAILTLAATSTTVYQGAFLLAVFSAGLAVPFLITAFAFSFVTKYVKKISTYMEYISKVGGVFLILLGILLLTNNFTLLIQYGFQFFEFLNYDGILNYL